MKAGRGWRRARDRGISSCSRGWRCGLEPLEERRLLNAAPVAEDDNVGLFVGEEVSLSAPGLLANDRDPEGDALTASLVSEPEHGVLVLSASGKFSYTPEPGFVGTDQFAYRVSDGQAFSPSATVWIRVDPESARPTSGLAPAGDEFVVGPGSTWFYNQQSVAMDLAGDFVVAYSGSDGSDGGIMLRRYAADGAPLTDPLLVNTTTAGDQTFPAVSMDDDGDFVVAWTSYGQDGSSSGVYVRRYSAQGAALSDEIQVNTTTTGRQQYPALALDSDGDFVVVWWNQDNNGIIGRRFNASAAPQGGEFQVNVLTSTTQLFPRVAADPSGDFVVTWTGYVSNGTAVYARRYSADGTAQAAPAVVSSGASFPQRISSVDMDAAGNYVVAYNAYGTGGNDVFARRYSMDGQAQGGTSRVNTTLPNGQYSAVVTVDPDGDYVVGWASYTPGSVSHDVYLQRYTSGGLKVGGEVRANTFWEAGQHTPSLASDAEGNIVVIWMSNSGTRGGVLGQRFALNAVPLARSDTFSLTEDQGLVLGGGGVLANDFDSDGQPLAAVLESGPAHGALSLASDGTFTYQPNPDFAGEDQFSYRANDGTSASAAVVVRLLVAPTVDAPRAVDDFFSVLIGRNLQDATVLGNDANPDGQPLTVQLVDAPAHGALTLQANGTFSYQPAAGYAGDDAFRYRLLAGGLQSEVANVLIRIGTGQFETKAQPDTYAAVEDVTLVVGDVGQGVLANDSDGDGPLTAGLVSPPSHGQIEFRADGGFTYQPQPNFNGVDEFTYRATDGFSSGVATVRVEVAAANDPPTAQRDLYVLSAGSLNVDAAHGVLANDADLDGDALTAQLNSPPLHGTVSLAADGSFIYAPGADFAGLDSFSYRAGDGALSTDPVFVIVSEGAAGDSPLAADNVYSTRQFGTLAVGAAQGLLANDWDAQGDPLSAILARLPERGRLNLAADGSFVYVPDSNFAGRDSFVYRAVAGGQESALATVWIDVVPGNQFEGDVKEWPLAGGGNGHAYVLLPDVLTWQEARDRAASLVYRGASGHLMTVTSQAEQDWLETQFGGSDGWLGGYQDHAAPDYAEPSSGWKWVTGEPWSFTQWGSGEPNDAGGEDFLHGFPRWNDLRAENSRNGLFVEFSTFPPPPPGAADDAFSGPVNRSIRRTAAEGLLANDQLPAGATAAIVTRPQHGVITLGLDGSFFYLPNAGYTGRDSFTYKAVSASGESNVATVWLKVGGNEFAPVAQADSYRVPEDGELVAASTAPSADLYEDFSGAALDDRLEGEGFKLANGVISRSGTPQVNDRQYIRTVAADYLGKDFTYEISFTTTFATDIFGTPPRQSMIIGLGSADIQPGFGLHEPVNSLFLRIGTPSTDGGAVTLSNGPLTSLATLGSITANGLHRARIEKVGDRVTFSVDAFYDGSFKADYAYVVENLAETAPFLTAENTRLFFGTAHNADYFDNMSVVVQPWRGVLANDSDADQQSLTAELVQGPSHGVVNLAPNGTFTYKPLANFSGVDSFTYLASDGARDSQPTTVTIVVDPTPDPTTAVDDAYQVDEHGELRVDLPLQSALSIQLNARDLVYDKVGGLFWASVPNDGVPSAGAVVSIDPNTGQVSAPIVVGNRPSALAVSADGQFLYIGLDGSSTVRRLHIPTRTPGPAASLGDGNRARDLEASPTDPNTFVVALNQGDTLNASGVAYYTNMARTYLRDGWLISDIDYSDDGAAVAGYWWEISSRPVQLLTVPPNPQELVSREYFIPGNPAGEIIWQRDRIYFSGSGQVFDSAKLNYQGGLPSGSVRPDETLPRIFVLSGNTIRVIDETSLGQIAAIPAPQAPSDGNGGLVRFGSSGLAFRNGNGRIYFVQSDLIGGDPRPRGVLLNDQDPDGVPLGASLVSNVAHGALTLNADGSFVYKPAVGYTGPDQFTYRVVDGAGPSNVATVLLNVRPINDPPVARNDSYATSQVGQVSASPASGVLANDSDPEGDALTAALVQGPAHGALAFNADGSFLYTPAAGFTGQDQFTYRASDGQLQSDVATVTIQVRSAVVDVALRAVANPSAGDTAAALPSSLAAVDVGSEYYVEIWVQDVGAAPAGLPGGQIDLDFDTARSDALTLGHGGLYNLIPTGAIDDAGGRIDDFGGGTINPAASNAPQWARLGYVRVLATADGLASYQLGPGALQFSRVGGGSVPWEQVDLSETLLVDHQAEAELEVRAVAQPTAVDAAGEVDALPTSLPWVDEWSGYWVEVWVRSTDEGAGQGISQAAANLLYDTRYGTAREIQYGPGFTSGRTGTIDDAAGRVTNLGAATTRSDVGDDRFALLARVRFAPGASDQAPLDETGHFVGPYDLALGLSDPAVRLVGAAANGATDLRAADLPLYAALYDIDDNDQIDYGDLSYFAAAFGKTVAGAVEPPYVWWANFDRQGAAIDFGDFSYLAANFGRTKEQGGLTYPANYPAAWAPLAASALAAQALDAPAQPLGGDAVGMSVQLVARATPSAGDSAAALPAGLTQVAVGGTYTIEVWVQDSAGIGVTGGLVDINYPQGRVDAGALEHGGVYTTFANGALRELLGRADDLGGGSVAAALGATPQWVRLGYFSFEVTGAGPLEFKLSPGQLQFSRYGEGNVAWADVNLGALTLNPALMGDLNSDHAVDLTDFGALKANFGTGTTWAQGDLDGNGRVDLGDFGRFKENFGRTAAALAAVLPPPPAVTPSLTSEQSHAAAVDLALAIAGDEVEEEQPWSL